MPKVLKRILLIFLVALGVLLAVVGGYVGYVVGTYERIADGQVLSVDGAGKAESVQRNTEYTVVTQNLGFGAYTRDFTFFMDGGTQSWAKSKESVQDCVNQAAQTMKSCSPDFVFAQEVDLDATRSYHVDQHAMLNEAFEEYSSAMAVNYHSAFLMWPLYQPHGASDSSIITYSAFKITSAVRRSFPVAKGMSKLLDLDRCYSVARVPVENGKELVLYNVHTSAYGSDDEVRTAQMTMLFADMQAEFEAGNYCVCGGDFNHDFPGDSTTALNGSGAEFGWAQPFPADLLANYAGIRRATEYTCGEYRPTCRNCDVPYEEGNFTIIVDGFLVSQNVQVNFLENVQTGFAYSDHNPVVMRFELT